MAKYGSYLVCNEYIDEVHSFLKQFFKERIDGYTFEGWSTFEVPDSSFLINLMKDGGQPLTKNMTFEIYCQSMKELEKIAENHGATIENFVSKKSAQHYKYYYIEIFGPQGICKIEVNFTENL